MAESRVLEQSDEHVPDYGKSVNIKTKRGVVKPRTPNQAQYIAHILDHDITFGIGPAGPENLPAVAAAVDALERQEIRRILLTRPAVEAGENSASCPAISARKWIRICARCTTRCLKCSALKSGKTD